MSPSVAFTLALNVETDDVSFPRLTPSASGTPLGSITTLASITQHVAIVHGATIKSQGITHGFRLVGLHLTSPLGSTEIKAKVAAFVASGKTAYLRPFERWVALLTHDFDPSLGMPSMMAVIEPVINDMTSSPIQSMRSLATEHLFAANDNSTASPSSGTTSTGQTKNTSPQSTTATSSTPPKSILPSIQSSAVAGPPTWADDETDEEDMAVVPRLALEDMEDELAWRRAMMDKLIKEARSPLSAASGNQQRKQLAPNRVTKVQRGRGGRGKSKVTAANAAGSAADTTALVEEWLDEAGENRVWKQRLLKKWEGEDAWWERDARAESIDAAASGKRGGKEDKDKEGEGKPSTATWGKNDRAY
jgi:hypothetical protein